MSAKKYIPWETHYDPARWHTRRRILLTLFRPLGFKVLGRLGKVEGLENVPREGRLVAIFNHIAFFDPLAILGVFPREAVPMMKAEALDYFLLGYLPRWWGTIPIWRGEVDLLAIRQSLAVLNAEEPLLIAPEGTRNSALAQGKLGMAYLAARAQAPLLPIALEGTEGLPTVPFSRRWRHQRIHIKIGHPFRYTITQRNPNRRLLRQMTDEAMYILAALLPPHRRGYYADLSKATQETIAWL